MLADTVMRSTLKLATLLANVAGNLHTATVKVTGWEILTTVTKSRWWSRNTHLRPHPAHYRLVSNNKVLSSRLSREILVSQELSPQLPQNRVMMADPNTLGVKNPMLLNKFAWSDDSASETVQLPL